MKTLGEGGREVKQDIPGPSTQEQGKSLRYTRCESASAMLLWTLDDGAGLKCSLPDCVVLRCEHHDDCREQSGSPPRT